MQTPAKPPTTPRPWFTTIPLAIAAAVAIAGLTLPTPATTITERFAPGQAAMRATIDPETGELKVSSSAHGAATLDPETTNALRQDSDGLTEVRHANGAVSVNLQGRFQSASVARIGEDGKVTICTDNSDGASHAMHEHSTKQLPEVE